MWEQNKAIVRRYRLEIANEGKLDLVDEIFAATFTMNGQEMTPESFKQFIQIWHTAFSDLEYTQEDLIAEGDQVVERWTARGTHTGELFDIPPTGKQITTSGILIHRIVDGKIVAFVEVTDGLGLMQQLGVVPLMD
jgi:predicted ester cyclase